MASSPINTLPPTPGLLRLAGSGGVQRVQAAPSPAASTESSSGAEDAVNVDTFPGTPPPEVMAAIAGASSAYDELAAKGLHVSFDSDSETGSLGISLQNRDGTPLASLKPSDVLALADGNEPE